ncbi:MAG: TonB-dependent receptor [Candidatus Eisenbacteria bacterium]
MKNSSFFIVLFALVTPSFLLAETSPPEETEEEYWGRPIVVTATRSEQDLTKVAANVTVLTESDIRAAASQTVDDLLRSIPGFSTLRQSSSLVGSSTAQAASLRGVGATSASRTLVMVDGVPAMDPFGGWVVWNRIPLENVERIEVVRGGGSGIWGNLAMGGIVNILTERPRGRSVRLMAEGGSAGTANLNFWGADREGPWSYSWGGRYYETDGYHIVREDQRGNADIPAYLQHEGIQGRLAYDLSAGSNVYLQGGYYDEDRKKGTPLDFGGTITRSYGAGGDFVTPGGSEWDVNVFTIFQSYDSATGRLSRDRNSITPNAYQYDVPSSSMGANCQWSKKAGKSHHLFLGGDYQRIEAESNEWLDYSETIFTTQKEVGGTQQLAGAYAQEIYTPSLYWSIVAAARVDYVRNSDGFYRTIDLETGGLERRDAYDPSSTTSLNPSLGAVYHANDDLSFRGSVYRSYRAPTVNELYRGFASRGVVNEANPNLEPEYLIGGEAGVDYRPGRVFFGRITGFWNEVENTITQRTIGIAESNGDVIEPCGPLREGEVCRIRDNVGRLLTAGVELELNYRPYKEWTLSGSYVFDHTEILESDEAELVGKWQRQVPRHQFVLKARFSDPSILTLAVQGRYVGERYEDDLNDQEVNDLFVVDLHLARGLGAGREVFVSVENLLDNEYEVRTSTTGIVETGMPRFVHGGVRIRL